jgi:hypothetical protein
MRTLAANVLQWLHQVALALWLGGILTLGAVVAPAVFGTAKKMGHTHWGMPMYTFAGTAIGVAFERFNYVVLACGAVMLVSGLAYGLLAGMCRRRLAARAALTALAWGVGAWLMFSLFPQMMAARAAGRMGVFDSMHRTYSNGFSIQLVLLLGVAALTGWLHLDRVPLFNLTPAFGHPSPSHCDGEGLGTPAGASG